MRLILLCGTLIFCSAFSFGQNDLGFNKHEISLGISDNFEFLHFKTVKGIYNLGYTYRLRDYLGIGVQLGYGQYLETYSSNPQENSIGMYLYRYAATGSFHFLTLFENLNTSIFDLFLKGVIGGHSARATDTYSGPDYTKLDYGAYFGATIKPLKNLGIYGQVGYGSYSYSQFGITVSF